MRLIFALLMLSSTLPAAPAFTAGKATDQGVEVVHLSDSDRNVVVTIVPSLGNRACELKVKGKNLLYFPTTLAEFKKNGGKGLNGIPFLAPWGNRLDGGGFWASERFYRFNPSLGNLSMNAAGIAIHGMLASSSLWEVVSIGSNRSSAHVTSRLEFWKHPELMANWPFAEEYLMTYTLTRQGLEVEVSIHNLSAEAMPVAIGFHPYFQIPDVPRSECSTHIPARKHVETSPDLVATGEFTDSRLPEQVSLKEHTLDDGFTDLVRDAAGRAVFSYEHNQQKIEVAFGPKYKAAIIYAPPEKDFICFEPMVAITNAINLAHAGKYSDLQMLAPGAFWQESFSVAFSGF